MRRRIGIIVLLGVLGALAYVSWPLVRRGFRVGGPPSPLESRWRTEEQWLVDSIVRDLAEMARYAADGRPAAASEVEVAVATTGAGPVKVDVTLGPGQRVERELALASYIWAPEEYRELARSLLEAVGASHAEGAMSAGMEPVLGTLIDLRAPVIEQVNQQVSARLDAGFSDPALHESAALVVGSLALREAAAWLSDNRGLLCRMTAHLAFAGALRAGAAPSLDGRVAEAALLVMAGRGADADRALYALDRQPGDEAGLRAWRRALRLRLSDDTRVRPADASLLERRELYGALLRAGDASAAVDYATELDLLEGTDAWRLVTQSEGRFSVETGNLLLSDALDLELAEIQEVRALARGDAVGEDELLAELNERATRCVTPAGPRAIGWGTWAAASQRHLAACLTARIDHLRRMLSVHDKADRELGDSARRFSALRLYPFVETKGSKDARRRPARLDDLITLIIEEPELISAAAWYTYSPLARDNVLQRGLPDRRVWFVPMLPRGTTFDLMWRASVGLPLHDLKRIQILREISPQNFTAHNLLVLARFGDKGGGMEEVEALFGERAHYDKRVLGRLRMAAALDPAARQRILQRECAAFPSECFGLGQQLVENGDLASAEVAYRRGFDLSSDRVLAANASGWLVKHYLDQGERERARAIAEEAGATGSAAGLLTLARYHERTGDYERSEAILQQERERYGDQRQYAAERTKSKDGAQDEDNLIGSYYRMAYQKKLAGYESKFLKLAADDFPNGLERAELASFSGFPTDGVAIFKAWPSAERAGLRRGDVIVALGGYRVRSERQYLLVRLFSDDPELSLIVFRHPGYLQLKARSATRLLGFDMRNHTSSAALAAARTRAEASPAVR